MADYSNFSFGDFTVAEVFALARESKELGDNEFVIACMNAIRLNKCAAQPCNQADLRHAQGVGRGGGQVGPSYPPRHR